MRIVIAEDSALFRAGLVRLLVDAGHDVIAEVGDAAAALETVRTLGPELVILDIRMPPELSDDGARVARIVRDENPTLGIVLLSQHVETRHSLELIGSGFFGYLLKDRVLDFDEFLAVLRRVVDGGTALDSEVVTRLLGARRADARLAALSGREREVLALMAGGHSNSGIAARLWLTERTVESHIGSILAKLELPNTGGEHRRVLAVIAYLDARGAPIG